MWAPTHRSLELRIKGLSLSLPEETQPQANLLTHLSKSSSSLLHTLVSEPQSQGPHSQSQQLQGSLGASAVTSPNLGPHLFFFQASVLRVSVPPICSPGHKERGLMHYKTPLSFSDKAFISS